MSILAQIHAVFLRVCIESVAIISERWMDVSSPVVHVLGDEGDCVAVLSSKRGTRFFQWLVMAELSIFCIEIPMLIC